MTKLLNFFRLLNRKNFELFRFHIKNAGLAHAVKLSLLKVETSSTPAIEAPESNSYKHMLGKELEIYAEQVNVHELPEIHHYWTERILRPKIEAAGIPGFYEVFTTPIGKAAEKKETVRIASLGSGNCDFEIKIVEDLVKKNTGNFVMECFEINPHMLERGRGLAQKAGISEYMAFAEADLNRFEFKRHYDIFIANHSLHHILRLEHLFDQVRENMEEGASFVINDVIGRNGHMLWPEALEKVQHLWEILPAEYKYNHQSKTREKVFFNADCSGESFEGIRAQDILPELLKRFHFEVFIGFANISRVFADRAFGHNFRKDRAFDKAFMDFVIELDELLIKQGSLKPTQMMAWLRKRETPKMMLQDELAQGGIRKI
jgi:SAM-dependent methyltransferase